MNVGYIGLGAMGGVLARLLVGKHPLTVWDLNPEAVASFEKMGAASASSAAEMARKCDVILLCLPRTENVRQVVFGPGGLAEGLSPGKIIVDQTSGVPSETREIAARLVQMGVAMADACISGNPTTVVPAGRGTIMVSGADETVSAVMPILNSLSTNVIRCGQRLGDAQAVKLVNNAMNAGCRLATLETAATGRKMGLSLQAIADAMNKSAARNRTSMDMLPALIEGRRATNFSLPLMLKDINLGIQLGQQAGAPMPIGNIVRALLQIGVNMLGEESRLEDVVQVTETLAGTKIAGASNAAQADTEALRIIDSAATACNRLITYEAIAMGRKYGLALNTLTQVVNTSTGWNGEAERILPALIAGGKTTTDATLRQITDDLRRLSDAAMRYGTPMLIGNAVRSQYELGMIQLEDGAGADAMATLYERMAGITFADAA